MAILLQDLKVGMQSDLYKSVIDEFVKGDYLFNAIPFEQIANPVSGGNGWVVSYTKVKEENKPTGFRDINGKYTDTESKREMVTVESKVYGGSFLIDRALRDQGGVENEVAYQMRMLIKGIKKGFSIALMNGSTSTNGNQFDGIDTLLKSSSTDVDAQSFDISTYENMKDKALEFATKLDEFLSTLDRTPSVLIGNKTLITKIKAMAKIAGINTLIQTQYGTTIDSYNTIPLVAVDDDVVKTNSNNTCLYALSFGDDGLVLGSPNSILDVVAPDFNTAQEQARGLVELRAVPIIRNSKSCGVLRNIKVK